MMMNNDPIVEEVRKFRDEHARKFNYDLNAICADLMEKQKRSGHKLVRRERTAEAVCEEPVEYRTKNER
jgi:hypothetical protein